MADEQIPNRHLDEFLDGRLSTTKGGTPKVFGPAPDPEIDPITKQHKNYWVLSERERSKGFVRPVRQNYRHLKCGVSTWMSRDIAETYAREPHFYGATFCAQCRGHYPVGENGEFVWIDEHGQDTEEKVGT